ncbi:hypothetical protein [Microcoleus sp. CAWBG58]|nr:hypothetical protein [Microcoleus sp. CAWBG58]
MGDRPSRKDRSPFLVSDDRSRIKTDRPSHQIPNTAMIARRAIALSGF